LTAIRVSEWAILQSSSILYSSLALLRRFVYTEQLVFVYDVTHYHTIRWLSVCCRGYYSSWW